MNMMNMEPRTPGPISKVLFKIAGADEATLRLCPESDWSNIRATSLLLIAAVIYMAAVLSLAAHEALTSDSKIHIDLIIGSGAVGMMFGLVDSYVFLRAGFYAEGLAELARGGLDLRGGGDAKVKARVFLGVRILFSIGLAQLTAIFVSLALYGPEVAGEINRQYQQQNFALIAEAKLQVDGEIRRAADAVKGQEAHLAALQRQTAAMREGSVNPSANDSSIQAQQREVDQLLAEKSQREAESAAAQTFSANELSGAKTPGNSGIVGRGPVRIAAEERAKAASARVAAADRDLTEARNRLDDLRKEMSSSDEERSRQAQQQLPQLDAEVQAATAQLTASGDNLTKLNGSREADIRAAVESAPDQIGRDQGLLAKLKALWRIAQDPGIKAVIILVDLVSLSLELACVLVKVTTLLPTTYAALVARDSYMRVVRIVDGMTTELDRGPEPRVGEPKGPPRSQSTDDNPMDPTFRAPPSVIPNDVPPQPPKRPRGRPRKPRPNGLS